MCGIVLHPRIGIPKELEYLSDEYMHYMEVAVKTAARLNMKVVLYDEAMYPSGSAHGKVVAENPKYIVSEVKEKTKGHCKTCPSERVMAVLSVNLSVLWQSCMGYDLNCGNVDKEELLEASIMSVDNYKVLTRILETCVDLKES